MNEIVEKSINLVGPNIEPQTRIVINNVLTFLTELKEDPEKFKTIDFSQTRELTAKICGVSLENVGYISQACTSETTPAPVPRENISISRAVRDIDDFEKSVIKRIVLTFYSKGENPSPKKVIDKAKDSIHGLKCCNTTMRNMLLELGYEYKLTPRGKTLVEKSDVACARQQFLIRIDELKKSGDKRPRIYLDKIWVEQNQSRKRAWDHTEAECDLINKIGKGGRLMVCQTKCTNYGILPDAKWVVQAMKADNEVCHHEKNSKVFSHWFTHLLQNLEEPSVIIMDNASFHSHQINHAPTSENGKCEIQNWLKQNNITFLKSESKLELLNKVKKNTPEILYHLDEIANELGHLIIRVPVYHCLYNPIDLIWLQIKEEVASKNHTLKISDVEPLIHAAIENVTAENWQKCVEQAEAYQDEDLQKENVCVNHVDDESDSEEN